MIVFGKERDYIVHDDENVKGFFGKYRLLSNFEVAHIEFEGLVYPSTENAYQAAKLLSNEQRKKHIDISPSESKKLSRKLPVRDDWEEVKYGVMLNVCTSKFSNHGFLRDALLETGDRYLEETNHWGDIYWGVCNGVGQNNLGKVLMEIRSKLK